MSTPTLTLAQVVNRLLAARAENQQLLDACYELIDALDQVSCACAEQEHWDCAVCAAAINLQVIMESSPLVYHA